MLSGLWGYGLMGTLVVIVTGLGLGIIAVVVLGIRDAVRMRKGSNRNEEDQD